MLILDTHTWIWWSSDPDRLSRRALKEIGGARDLGIAAIGCWEFAVLAANGRIAVDRGPMEWMEQPHSELGIELLHPTHAFTLRSTQLGGGFHGDPADRLIVATALVQNAAPITKDARIRAFEIVRTIW